MKKPQQRLLVLFACLMASQSIIALGLPQRLYPAKVIKKSIQVFVRRVSH